MKNINQISQLSDQNLYQLCKDYGQQALRWSREFAFLLPEVYKRRLYRKYHCTSIHMFAAKLAGMSYEVVDRILNLSNKLLNKPLIWAEFQTFGWSKLRVIAEVSNFETEEFWVDKLHRMTKAVLEEYVRRYKEATHNNLYAESRSKLKDNLLVKVAYTNFVPGANEVSINSLINKPEIRGTLKSGDEKNTVENLGILADVRQNQPLKVLKKLKFRVDAETEFLFKEFKQDLEEKKKISLTMGETLKELLKLVKKQKIEINQSNESNIQNVPSETFKQQTSNHTKSTPNKRTLNSKSAKSRYIPFPMKKYILQKYNHKCAFPDCNNPYSEIHHTERFAKVRQHSTIYPICKLHHQAAHSGIIKNENQTVENWKFDFSQENAYQTGINGNQDQKLEQIFQLYEKLEKEKIDAKVRSHWR